MEIPRVEPERPHDRLGEIVVDPPPAIAEVEAKLRGEASTLGAGPRVFTMRAVENGRYYSAQFIGMSTFNFAYVAAGRPAAAREAFCSPDRGGRGEAEGHQVGARPETDFVFELCLVLNRTQLLNLGDIENVKKVQAAYKVQTLSQFLGTLAPAAPPGVE